MTRKQANLWWGPPGDFNERKNERKVSWLELFYDLVYVAAISQFTHHLAEHLDWSELGYSFLLFAMIFWSWVNGSQYYDLHGNDSVRTRVFTFLQMLAVAAVAITIKDAFEGHHRGFVIAFAVIQGLITYLWWSVGLYDRSHRVFNKYYTFNYIIAFVLLIVSFFTDNATATILWIIVLVLDMTPALTGARTIVRVLKERGQVFSASATLVERFGLFTIIVLAENILGTVTGIAEIKDKHPAAWIAFILAILVSFLLWSIYFDMTSEQETKKGYAHLQWLIFLHYPLLAAFGVLGASIRVLLSEEHAHAQDHVQWMFCTAIATILFMTVCIAAIMKEEEEDRAYIRPVSRLLIVTGIVVLLIPLFERYLGIIAFLSVISLVLLVPVFVGIRSWVRYKFFGKR
ncbi:MAG: low temperature requirement protein A [Bacteroidota bacterium]